MNHFLSGISDKRPDHRRENEEQTGSDTAMCVVKRSALWNRRYLLTDKLKDRRAGKEDAQDKYTKRILREPKVDIRVITKQGIP